MIPDSFAASVRYAEEAIFYIKKAVKWDYTYDNSLRKKYLNRKQIAIGVSLPTVREERWVRDKEIMESYAKKKGVALKIEIADFDSAKQVSQVEKLISQGIDALILVPISQSIAAELAEKAHKAGIKVISYEELIQNSYLDINVAFNKLRVGELQGGFLVKKVPKGNYIIMYGDPDTVFKEGAMEYIQPLANIGNIKIVADKPIKNCDPKIAYNIVREALMANKNKIDAILAPNDATAGAAIEALKEQGLAGKVAVTGQDAELAAVRRIVEGIQLMTVFKDTRKLGETAIDVAIKLVNGESVTADTKVNNGKMDVPSILISPVLIDKSNINSVLIDSGYLKAQDIYRRK